MPLRLEQFIPSYGTQKIVFEFVVLLFLILCLLLYKNRTLLLEYFKTIRTKVWVFLFVFIALFALFLLVAVPRLQGMWLDESYYQAGAKNELQKGVYATCFTTATLNHECETIKANQGWGFLIAIVYFLFGVHVSYIMFFSIILLVLSTILVFLIARMMSKNDFIAFLSAIIFALFPVQIEWSGRTESSIPGLFLLLLAFFFMLLFKKIKQFDIALLSFGFLLFSMQTRIEHVFLIPLFFVFFIISKGKVKTKIQAYHIFILFLFSLIFVFGFLPQLGNAIQGRNAVHLYTFESMQKNVIFQLSRFHHEYLPIPFYIALFGLGVTLFSKQRKLFGIAFFLFLILFLFWPSRVLDSNQPRYYIPIFWVYAIFASYGIYTILKLLQRIKLPWISVSLQIIFILFIFSSASIVLHRADLDTTGNLVLYYEATRVPDQIQELVEPNSIIVGSYSEIIALDGATSLRVMRTSTFLQLQNETLESNTFYFYDGMLSILPPFADEPEIALKEQFLSSYTVEVMDGFPTPYINATLYKINGKK